MAVCRDWYQAIPQYTQNIWKGIQLAARDASMDHQRRRQCLGSHVKHVVLQSIEEKQLITLARRLVDWQCTEIEQLELVHCTTPDLKTLIDALGLLGSHLTHLHLTYHEPSIPLLPMLNICRELTHFTYQHKASLTEWSQCASISPKDNDDGNLGAFFATMPIDYLAKITYLRIDAVLDKEQLEGILKRCPELRCFVGVSYSTAGLSCGARLSYDFIDVNAIISLCPKINSLASNFSYNHFSQLGDPDSYISDISELRYYNAAGIDGHDQIAMHLAKNQGILEFLSILRPAYNDEDWSPIFESLRMPNLRILICGNIKLFTTSSLITMLNSCSVLQKLDLDCLNSTFDSALIRLLCTMNSVRSLQIKNVEFRDALALMTFLERFPELETLGLEYISLPPEFPEYFQCLPQLKALTISEITWIRNESQQVNIDEAFARFLSQLAYGAKLEYLRLISIPELK